MRRNLLHRMVRPIITVINDTMNAINNYLHQMVRRVRTQQPSVLAWHFDLFEPKVTIPRLVLEISCGLAVHDGVEGCVG